MRALLLTFLLISLLAPTRAAADESGLNQQRQIDDLTATIWIAPGVFRPTGVEVWLADAAGRPPGDVSRVDVTFAMRGMNHGARGIVADPVEPGIYQAADYLLAMNGSWWMALRVERADGRLQSALFPFEAAPERNPGAAYPLYVRPVGQMQVEDVAVTPGEIIPDRLDVVAARPVRLEVMYVDRPTCGAAVTTVDPPATALVSSEGLAELTFVPTRTGRLALSCTPAGLMVGVPE